MMGTRSDRPRCLVLVGDRDTLVADNGLTFETLDRRLSYDDFGTTIAHALAWERRPSPARLVA